MASLLLQGQHSPEHRNVCKLGVAAVAHWIDRFLHDGLPLGG